MLGFVQNMLFELLPCQLLVINMCAGSQDSKQISSVHVLPVATWGSLCPQKPFADAKLSRSFLSLW